MNEKKTKSFYFVTIIFFIIFQIQNVLTFPAPQDTAIPTSTPVVPTVGVTVVTNCTQSGVAALTFDDGPTEFTGKLLDLLDTMNVTATFFVNGKNNGCVYDNADVLIRAKAKHQIGSHTWSHANLAELEKTPEKIDEEMKKLDTALEKILGVTPKYMRPPYGEGADSLEVQKVMANNGFAKIVLWDVDAEDATPGTTLEYSVKQYTDATPPPAGHISLSHDATKSTVELLVPQEIKILGEKGFRFVTVGECLGEPTEDLWYKTSVTPGVRDSTWVC